MTWRRQIPEGGCEWVALVGLVLFVVGLAALAASAAWTLLGEGWPTGAFWVWSGGLGAMMLGAWCLAGAILLWEGKR